MSFEKKSIRFFSGLPEGMCESAWESISPFVMTLAHGGENIYDGWIHRAQDVHKLIISMNVNGA